MFYPKCIGLFNKRLDFTLYRIVGKFKCMEFTSSVPEKNTHFNVNLFCIPCIFPLTNIGYAVYFYLVKIQKHILKKQIDVRNGVAQAETQTRMREQPSPHLTSLL